MRNEQIIDELQLVKEHYQDENDGCFPLCLEEAQRVLKWNRPSFYVTHYWLDCSISSDTPVEDIPAEAWELLCHYDLYDLREAKDFFRLLGNFKDKEAIGILYELFTAGFYVDVMGQIKLVASWV